MKPCTIYLTVIILLSALFFSCDVNSPESLVFNSPKCSIISMSEISFEHYSYADMSVTIKNNGDGPTAFDVGCYIKLKNGNLILDDGYGDFGTLDEGEAREEGIRFYDLEESDKIGYMEIVIYWYDAEGDFYSKEF